MPKLACPGGHIINLSLVPAPGERRCFTDEQWDKAVDAVVQGILELKTLDPSTLSEVVNDNLSIFTQSIVICPQCGRLALPIPDGPYYDFYVPEKSQPIKSE